MSDFGDRMRALAARLLAKFGVAATLHRKTEAVVAGGVVTTPSSFADDGCISSPPLDADYRLIASEVVPMDSVRAFLDAATVDSAPVPGDFLTLAGVRYAVIMASPLQPDDGAVAAYELHLSSKR